MAAIVAYEDEAIFAKVMYLCSYTYSYEDGPRVYLRYIWEKAMTTSNAQMQEFLSRLVQVAPGLSSSMMQYWIQHPRLLKEVLQRALMQDAWSVTIGRLYNAKNALSFLDAKGIVMDEVSVDVVRQMEFVQGGKGVHLTLCSAKYLGLADGFLFDDLVRAARRKDLDLVPHDAVLELLLQEEGRLKTPCTFAMNPVHLEAHISPKILHAIDVPAGIKLVACDKNGREGHSATSEWIFRRVSG